MGRSRSPLMEGGYSRVPNIHGRCLCYPLIWARALSLLSRKTATMTTKRRTMINKQPDTRDQRRCLLLNGVTRPRLHRNSPCRARRTPLRNGGDPCLLLHGKRCCGRENRWRQISRRDSGRSWRTLDKPRWARKGSAQPSPDPCKPRLQLGGGRIAVESLLEEQTHLRPHLKRRRESPKHLVKTPLRQTWRCHFGVNSELIRPGRRPRPQNPQTVLQANGKNEETRTSSTLMTTGMPGTPHSLPRCIRLRRVGQPLNPSTTSRRRLS
jgi:hypothetical protein